MLTTFAFFFF